MATRACEPQIRDIILNKSIPHKSRAGLITHIKILYNTPTNLFGYIRPSMYILPQFYKNDNVRGYIIF